MIVCPSQNISDLEYNRSTQFHNPLSINTIPKRITRTCQDHTLVTDYNIHTINYLDFKLTKSGYHLDLLHTYLISASGFRSKTLHLCNIHANRPTDLFELLRHHNLLRILNDSRINPFIHLELYNIDYFSLTDHSTAQEYINQSLKIQSYYQIDYHHIISDSTAIHYPIHTKGLSIHHKHSAPYNDVCSDVGVVYDPRADRTLLRQSVSAYKSNDEQR